MTAVDPITELAARWQAAEEQLYPALLFDEQRYEHAMLVLRAAVDDLQASCATVDDLVVADQRRGEIVEQAARRAGVELTGVDSHQLAAAALRQRLGGIRREERRRAAGAAVAAARGHGGGWATLYERGGPPPQPPYEQLAVRVPAGQPAAAATCPGVHAWITLDVRTDAPRFGVVPVIVELADDVPTSPPQPTAEPEQPDSLEDWQAAIARLRRSLDSTDDLDSPR